ncbi:MAG: S9 family peptidase, partial [Acidobacteriota bacterium]
MPPRPPQRPRTVTLHGDPRTDEYHWLRDRDDPEVVAYLEAENAHADAELAATQELQELLYREMVGRIRETDQSCPVKDGGHVYYSRTEEGRQYRIYCRREAGVPFEEAEEQVLLDLNAEAEGHDFLALGAFAVSDDGNLLAYSLDRTGFRVYHMEVKDLRTGELLPDRAEDVGAIAWAADGRTIFYTTKDAAKRPHRIYRHRLGDADDALVHEETDERFRVWVHRTRSLRFLLAYAGSHTTAEVRCLAADRPEDEWRLLLGRVPERDLEVADRGDRFWARINDTGRNFRLVSFPIDDPSPATWEEILPHREDVMLEGLDLFAGHLVVQERADGLPRLRVRDLRSGDEHLVRFPEEAYSVAPTGNVEWDTPVLRYAYESMVTPRSTYDYDMNTRTAILRKRDEVVGGHDPGAYVTRRLHAPAPDGVRVPISLVHRKGFPADGTGPLLLIGYGSYGFPYPLAFRSERLSLLDRGVALAIAHIRGGGEMGKAWHDQGRMLSKKTTFTDFIACAEHLVRERLTSPDRLVIQGGSAGGLLMGAVTNLRPELFRAVVSQVPFVDVLNTMLDDSLPLTVGEYEEWGNPNEREAYEYIRSYCPYTNLRPGSYPSMLVKTSLNDSQVMYWEPAKYVARLRTLKTDDRPLLLVTNMGGGHGGSSGRYDRLRETALDYAFILTQV